MGNCTSGGTKLIKLVTSKGELKLIPPPLAAADLMLDSPGYAVAPLESLCLTRRITAVRAEDFLTPGKAYLMVPVGRVGCRVTFLQLEAVEKSVSGGGRGEARRCRVRGSKVLPEGGGCEEVEEGSAAAVGGGGFRQGRNGRVWSPVLEPIIEGC